MTDQVEDAAKLWRQVISILVDKEQTDALGLDTLRGAEKALLNSVTPSALWPGFFLLATDSPVVVKLVNAKLKDPIEQVLHHITGEETEAVITVDDEHEAEQNEALAGESASPLASQSTGQQSQAPQAPRTPVAGQSPLTPTSHAAGPSTQAAQPTQQSNQTTPSGTGLPGVHTAASNQSSPASTAGASPLASNYGPDSTSTEIAEQAPVVATETILPPPRYRGFETPTQMKVPDGEPTLNRKYTFDTFVTGPQNQFAAAAAVAVAESPARAYNPLFIYGGAGLGKTHLLHAIGHYARNLYPNLRVRYVTSEDFTNDFVNSLRDDAKESFKRRYRDLDILIVDDIQFLAGKKGLQEEFFHTFNALHQSDRQIVLSSDRPPGELNVLEERLRTRFAWGLMTDLQVPNLETRIAILSKKAQMSGLEIPYEVLQYIAENTSSSIRELEGKLVQINATSSLMKVPVSLELAEEIFGEDEIEVHITPQIVIQTTADYFGLTVSDLLGPGKTRPVSHARQIAMYLTRELTALSLPAIGKEFGNRDHSTVLHANRKITKEIADKKPSGDQVNDLTTRIRDRARGAS